LALLPTRARQIFLGGTKVDRAARELTTDDVRALARAMNAAGLQPWNMGESALRYQLDYPNVSGGTLSVFIGPVLPHGEAVFLGPG
jgi:hypothetical protein